MKNKELKKDVQEEAGRILSEKPNSKDLSVIDNATILLSQLYKEPVKEDVNGIFDPQKNFAIDIFNAWLENDIVIGKAPMQFGKTGSILYLCNELLRPIMKPGENAVFMTSMSDTALYIQNTNNLSNRKFTHSNGKKYRSNIITVKMFPNFRNDAEKYMSEYNIKYLIFDECDYGSGDKSLFNKTFFNRLKRANFNVKLLLVSATPYCALNAVFNGELNSVIVEAQIPDNYFGVYEMLRLGMITDAQDIYGDDSNHTYSVIHRGVDKSMNLSKEFISDLNWFLSQDGGGIAIVRAKNDTESCLIRSLSMSHFRSDIDIISDVNTDVNIDFDAISIGVKSNSIKDVLGDGGQFLYNKVVNNNKKVLLVVINALAAGKDLGDLKEHVRLVVETRRHAVANGSQGLVGRLCGYHDNRNIRIVASKRILELYSKMEINSEVMRDNKFIDEAVELKLDFSTQLKKGARSTKKIIYEKIVHDVFTYEDFYNSDPRLKSLFPETDETFGNWEHLEGVLSGKNSVGLSPINTQRKSKYVKNPEIFATIWRECEDKSIDFGGRFHRFRAEGNDVSRLRIKRGIIMDDEKKVFYIIDRISDGEEDIKHATIKNKSCYIDID